MKRLTLLSAIALSLLVTTSCDDTPGIVDVTEPIPALSYFEVYPSSVNFFREEGIKDTLITFDLSVLSNEPLPSPPIVTFSLKQSSNVLVTDSLSNYDADLGRYSGLVSIPFTTTTYGDYLFYVHSKIPERGISNLAEATVKIRGFATGIPEVIYTEHPETVQIPSSGSHEFLIKAKVTHPDGQANIQRVNLEMIDSSNRNLGVFRLYDDGTNGDEVAQDSIYTTGFTINSSNQPDTYTLMIYAIDLFDTVSDTVTTQMSFVR